LWPLRVGLYADEILAVREDFEVKNVSVSVIDREISEKMGRIDEKQHKFVS
jgi:hypothetical protein